MVCHGLGVLACTRVGVGSRVVVGNVCNPTKASVGVFGAAGEAESLGALHAARITINSISAGTRKRLIDQASLPIL
jgi:hypothetical protein